MDTRALAPSHIAARAAAPAPGPGTIGPNAVIQLANALGDIGPHAQARVFARAGLAGLLPALPDTMVDERIPQALFGALFEAFSREEAQAIAAEAGRRTADYVLANRIPRPARLLLPVLPRPVATRALLGAIERAAWTFAGSGRCRVAARPPEVAIARNPLAMPGCVWHAAVFARLFEVLVAGDTTVRHTQCCREGGRECRFAIEVAPPHQR